MNRKEALHALVEGKLIRHPQWQEAACVRMLDDGSLVTHEGRPAGLRQLAGYQVFEPANPHPQGTFAWAREEARRERRVRRSVSECSYDAAAFAPDKAWALEHVDAVDWEIA